jgi:alkylation response protein AidB-like acyl-CoA dehydrogenase
VEARQGAPDATKACAMAKKFVTEAGSRVADQCLQLHGGYGYLADYGIEKIVRDLRVHQILEGTNEIMRLIVARDMLAGRLGMAADWAGRAALRLSGTRPEIVSRRIFGKMKGIGPRMTDI